MDKEREFNDILDKCLDRILIEGETVEQCLESYPALRDELEPLLLISVDTKAAFATAPLPEFKERARYQYHRMLAESKPKRRLPLLGMRPRWAMVVSIFLVILLAGSGTVAAADSSMPDSPLYSIKLLSEQVRIRFISSDIDKAEIYAKLADKRVNELVYMAGKDNPALLLKVTERLRQHLTFMAGLKFIVTTSSDDAEKPGQQGEFPGKPGQFPGKQGQWETTDYTQLVPMVAGWSSLKKRIGQNMLAHPLRLRGIMDRVPDSVKPLLDEVIAESIASYTQLLNSLD